MVNLVVNLTLVLSSAIFSVICVSLSFQQSYLPIPAMVNSGTVELWYKRAFKPRITFHARHRSSIP